MGEPTEYELELGQIVWDYFQLGHKIQKVDVIMCLASLDTLPAKRAADLYLNGWAPYLVFSGGKGRFYERMPNNFKGLSEAAVSAEVAVEMGVPRKEIFLEEKSTNTNESIRFTRALLAERGIYPQSVISVHMPSAERRDYGTIKKEWPGIDVIIASPRAPFSKYHIEGFQGQFSRRDVITTLIGNVHRTIIYPKRGWMVEQEDAMPANVRTAYQELVNKGYTEHLLRDERGKIIEI